MPQFLNNTNFNTTELQSMELEQLSSAPSSPTTARMYYDTTLGKARYYTGSTWINLDAGSLDGSGTATYVAQWNDSNTLEASTLIKSGAGVLTLSAAGAYTLTVPATGTAALLATNNLFTVRQDIRSSGNNIAAGLHVPGDTADAKPAIYAGSTTSGYAVAAIRADTFSGNAIEAYAAGSGSAIYANTAAGTFGAGLNLQAFGNGVPMQLLAKNADTTSKREIVSFYRSTTGTSADNIGGILAMRIDDAAGSGRLASQLVYQLITAATSTWKGRATLLVGDSGNTDREAFRAEGTGTATAISFYGATAVVKPTVTGSRGSNAALTSLLTALANLGLITNSST